MAKVKAVFYLPIRDNDGRDLAEEILQTRDKVYVKFSAWTLLGRAEGAFRMAEGELALDTNEVYSVILDETDLGELERIIKEFRKKS